LKKKVKSRSAGSSAFRPLRYYVFTTCIVSVTKLSKAFISFKAKIL